MLGLLYLILACFVGYNLIKKVFPGLFSVSETRSFFGKPVKLENWMVTFPAAFLVGTLLMTWFTYIASYVFKFTTSPMLYGNLVSMLVFSGIAVYLILSNKQKYIEFFKAVKRVNGKVAEDYYGAHRMEILFTVISLLTATFWMFYTFSIKGGNMYIGSSVCSDFAPHLAVIRSFSFGANFPTDYPHFADGHIRYHFLFQFLAGNLEFLGFRLDWAFNIPSILALVAFAMLLYSFSVILIGGKWIGVITAILFFFRSSFAFFTFIWSLRTMPLGQVISKIFSNDKHIGNTLHEDWGLWAQNVYVNQRHFAFSLGVLMLILILLLPLFKKMIDALAAVGETVTEELKKKASRQAKAEAVAQGREKATKEEKIAIYSRIKADQYKSRYVDKWIKEFIFSADAWLPRNIVASIIIGLILGLISFWNGAVVVATLPILFIIALLSKHRLDYVIIAGLTLLLSTIETSFFIGGSAVKPQIVIGFLAENKDIKSIIMYYVQLLGVMPFVVIAGLFVAPKGARWLSFAFFTPIILATTVMLTPDVAVNHKYVMIAVILLNIIAANLLLRMYTSKPVILKVLAVIVAVLMTITGAVDFITLYNLNRPERSVVIDTKDPVTMWVSKNTKPNEIFLTDMYSIHPLLLGGRKIFFGWPYFTWSAGYDTAPREAALKQIYGGTDPETVKQLVKANNISYIVIENGNRTSEYYKLNEELIKSTFKLVYENNASGIAIYRTY